MDRRLICVGKCEPSTLESALLTTERIHRVDGYSPQGGNDTSDAACN
jgi:hypothetical protein